MLSRGKSPGTRRAVAKANLGRKILRLSKELGELTKPDIDQVFAQSPCFTRVIFFLHAIGESDSRWGESATEIETLLKEMIIENPNQ